MSCKVQFPAGVQDNVTLDNSAKLAQARVLDKDGNFYSEISNLTSENIKENLLNLIKDRP